MAAATAMDLQLPSDDDPRRLEVRDWLAAHPEPTPEQLARAGYVVPHWPRPWGLGADPEHQLVIDDELRRAGVRRPVNPIGIGHCGPVLLTHGTDDQRRRYLWPMLSGAELWCQLFSEPGAGSDLAGLSTRAVRDGDVYVVNGQKIWTSVAEHATYGILLARTDPDAPKHRGISYFIVPMDLPGIEVRPIRNMTGSTGFNEVFFTEVRVPAENLIGREHEGWTMAQETLAHERVSLSTGGAQWGFGPTARDLVEAAKLAGGVRDPVLRDRLVAVFVEGEILRYHHLRQVAAVLSRRPGPDASLRKALNDPHGQHVFALANQLAGPHGMLAEGWLPGPHAWWWPRGFLFSPALTIGGGTAQVLRNVIAERLLGLPREPDPDAARPWRETRHSTGSSP